MPRSTQLLKLLSGIAETPEKGQFVQYGPKRLDRNQILETNTLNTATMQKGWDYVLSGFRYFLWYVLLCACISYILGNMQPQ